MWRIIIKAVLIVAFSAAVLLVTRSLAAQVIV